MDLFRKTSNPIVSFFALTEACKGVERDWQNGHITDKMKETVKSMALEIFSKLHGTQSAGKRHLRGKIANLISILATREWPQRWPNLHLNMINIGLQFPSSAMCTLITFRTLSENTHETCFFSKLPSKRKSEILRGLKTIQSDVLKFAYQLLSLDLKNENARSSDEMLREALRCVASFASWVEMKCLVSNPHNILNVLCAMICQESLEIETRELAASSLNVLTGKKGKLDDEDVAERTILLKIADQVLKSVGAALERSSVKEHVTFRRECFRTYF